MREESLCLEFFPFEARLFLATHGQALKCPPHIGGIAMVVTTAMATIAVKRRWVKAPMDKPIDATITSVEPRAFMPQPTAKDSA